MSAVMYNFLMIRTFRFFVRWKNYNLVLDNEAKQNQTDQVIPKWNISELKFSALIGWWTEKYYYADLQTSFPIIRNVWKLLELCALCANFVSIIRDKNLKPKAILY